MINKNRLVRLTQRLVQIDSQNPIGNEFEIAGFVSDHLKRLGLEVKIYEFKKKRSNVIGVLRGKNPKRSLLLTPHLDTVPAGKNWKVDPFAATIKEGKIYGLGATDCKCNLACGMEAINSIVENKIKLDYNLIFAATADEESGSDLGLIPLLEKGILKPDAAVVLDSDDFEIIVEQKGLFHLKVKIHGKRAHGAYPDLGINAIEQAVRILGDLNVGKLQFKKNKYLKPPTLNIGTIKGGDKVNVVADWCEFELDHRFLPGMNANDFLKYLKSVIKKYTSKFEIEIEGVQEPYSIETSHPLVKYLMKSMHSLHIRPVIRGSEGATVITFFQHKNIPAVATGFGSSGCAHISNEYAKIDNIYRGAKVLEELLKIFKF